jgi:hypothetical protein
MMQHTHTHSLVFREKYFKVQHPSPPFTSLNIMHISPFAWHIIFYASFFKTAFFISSSSSSSSPSSSKLLPPVSNVGPELRFINLFSAICFIEGRPSRPSQEMCIRLLWMNETDRYSFGVSFHQMTRDDLVRNREK